MLLHQQFVRVAKQNKNKMALVDCSTDRRLTYNRALIGSLILARKFRHIDDGYVGVMIPTSAGCMLTVLALVMCGKVPVMINYSTGAADNIRYARTRCGFKTVITSRTVLEKVDCPEMDDMLFVDDLMKEVTGFDKLRAALQAALPTSWLLSTLHQGHKDDTLVILFTSGSEKAPKGVELTHRNIGSNVQAIQEAIEIKDSDVFLAILPLFHVYGQTANFWLPLCSAATAVTYGNPLEFKTVAGIIRDEKPTIAIATPFFLSSYLRAAKPGDFSSLRIVVVGADKMPDRLREGYESQHGVATFEGYGATETSPVVSVNLPGQNKPGSIGKPLPGVQVRIVDVDSGEDLPAGEEGKLLVKGDLVMKGYFDDLEETILHINNGWYETGDMGMLDEDGYLWHRGRLKRFVKIGGEMVSLVRVEMELEALLPEGVECCVVEMPDVRKGAVLAVAVSEEVDQKSLLKTLGKRLPPIAMPKHFVVLEELPKMGSGKVDFRTTTTLVQERLKT
ncbi:MAG: AMP-binding protein [Gammaproteobacteria bacterium]|nr:AMP-binding protein [Gammaproteobacteria bacterium]MCF6364059.1 AMP-binding protein [Gammaproteobacteria bacterium]